MRTIAGLGAEEQMRERYHRGTDEVFDSYMRYEKTHRWMYLIRALLGGAVTLLGIGFALTYHVENYRWVSDTPAASLVTVASIIAMMGGTHLDYPELPHRMAIRQDCARQGRPPRRSRGRTPGRAEEPAHRRGNGAAGTRRTGSRGEHPRGARTRRPRRCKQPAHRVRQPARLQPHRARLRRGARPHPATRGEDLKDASTAACC